MDNFNHIFSHYAMLADKVRLASYKRAIFEVIKKNNVVCDIGTGSGILAFLSILAGAKKVYAIERDEVIQEAKKLAQINRLGKKIIFVKGISDKIKLPEKVDVIVSEIIGFLGVEENLIKIKTDARKRFLKSGGRIIPSWLELYLVPVESKDIWEKKIGFWNRDFHGIDFTSVKDCAVSQRYIIDCSKKVHYLDRPYLAFRFNFYQDEEMPVILEGEFSIAKKSILHGMVGYFKVGLSNNVILSTEPKKPLTHWQQTFFPVQNASPVRKGDKVHCRIKAIPCGNNVFWDWEISVHRDGLKVANFCHSNLNITKEELLIGREDFKPMLTEESNIHRRVLNLCDGNRTVKEIANIIYTEYPKKYKTVKNAAQGIIGTIQGRIKV